MRLTPDPREFCGEATAAGRDSQSSQGSQRCGHPSTGAVQRNFSHTFDFGVFFSSMLSENFGHPDFPVPPIWSLILEPDVGPKANNVQAGKARLHASPPPCTRGHKGMGTAPSSLPSPSPYTFDFLTGLLSCGFSYCICSYCGSHLKPFLEEKPK